MNPATSVVSSPATMEWIMGIAGVIIMLLLTANGFWISRLVNSIDKLRENLEKLTLSAGRQDEKFIACKERCEAENGIINDTIDDHARKIADHDIRLYKHDEQIALLKTRAR
jgi:hypothetical protein